ncbi:LysR family transcriptional regulator substrate-binding protein [Dorea longicatena]|nr:LysR family transcriptional regulator substrate-binding protein [Dorea longicatena]
MSKIHIYHDENKIAPHISYYSGDDYAVMSMVENELGIGILSELVMKRCDYYIVTRSLKPELHREIVIAVKNEKNASVAVRKFLQFVRKRENL